MKANYNQLDEEKQETAVTLYNQIPDTCKKLYRLEEHLIE